MLLKEFILDQFVSPRASRILKEHFPKSWLISTPDAKRSPRHDHMDACLDFAGALAESEAGAVRNISPPYLFA